MNDKRPVFRKVFSISLPFLALISGAHRVSGAVLVLLFPFSVYLFSYSLSSEEHFNALQTYLSYPLLKLFFWLCLMPLCYHLVSGIRHLLMELHIGEELKSARRLGAVTVVVSGILILCVGVWLW